MELARRIPQRRRLKLAALVAFPAIAVMTAGVVALSSLSLYWSHSPAEVAVSVGLAVTAVVLCGVAGLNARRARRAYRYTPPDWA